MNAKINRIWRWFQRIVLLYVCVLGGLYLAQTSLIYHPGPKPVPAHYQLDEKTALQADRSVTTEDGLELHGWFWPPEKKGGAVVVWFHGNAGTYADRLHAAPAHLDEGRGILLAEYRGYGGNSGTPSEAGLYKDARAWIAMLLAEGYQEQDIILYGESLGSGSAVQMAREYPAIRMLVLQVPYTSLPDVAATRYFFVPVNWLMKDHFRNIDKIGDVTMPVMIVQGSYDTIVPLSHGRILFDAAPEPKRFIRYEGYGHADLPLERIAKDLSVFLKETDQADAPN